MAHLQGEKSVSTLTSIPAATGFSFLPHEVFFKKMQGETECVLHWFGSMAGAQWKLIKKMMNA